MKRADIKNTLIIIPVYNCEKHLDELFHRLSLVSEECQVLCINDGSTDNSLQMIKKNNVKCIDLFRNTGKGYALKTGFAHAKLKGYEYALTMDADLQHDPKIIPNILKTQNLFHADLVIGFRRFTLKNMPFARFCSNSITSSVVSYMSNSKILDSQSGFRLYDLSFIDVKKIKTTKYQMETEILLKYLKKGAKVFHTEIPVIYNDEKSNISHMRDIYNFTKVMVNAMINKNDQ